jgi:hypothetical protein
MAPNFKEKFGAIAKLREFRDGAKLFFKVDEVDKLSEEFSKIDLSAAEEVSKADATGGSEIALLLDESGEIGLSGKGGPDKDSDALKLTDDDLSLDKLGKITKADTNVETTGINILSETDEGYKLAEDTKGETVAEEQAPKVSGGLDDDINMESVGSGSGLLDLSLQADDTSLGAVLDDILPTSKEAEAASAPAEGSAEADQIFEHTPSGSAQPAEEPAMAAAVMVAPMGPAGAMVQFVEPMPTGADHVCSVVLFIPLLAMIITGMFLLAAYRGIIPGLLQLAGKNMVADLPLIWLITIALTVLILLMVLIAGMSGGPKKEKKPKPEKKIKEKKKR